MDKISNRQAGKGQKKRQRDRKMTDRWMEKISKRWQERQRDRNHGRWQRSQMQTNFQRGRRKLEGVRKKKMSQIDEILNTKDREDRQIEQNFRKM